MNMKTSPPRGSAPPPKPVGREDAAARGGKRKSESPPESSKDEKKIRESLKELKQEGEGFAPGNASLIDVVFNTSMGDVAGPSQPRELPIFETLCDTYEGAGPSRYFTRSRSPNAQQPTSPAAPLFSADMRRRAEISPSRCIDVAGLKQSPRNPEAPARASQQASTHVENEPARSKAPRDFSGRHLVIYEVCPSSRVIVENAKDSEGRQLSAETLNEMFADVTIWTPESRFQAGQALQKHGSRGEDWPKVSGNSDGWPDQAVSAIDEFLKSPNMVKIYSTKSRFGGIVLDFIAPDGRAARYDRYGLRTLLTFDSDFVAKTFAAIEPLGDEE